MTDASQEDLQQHWPWRLYESMPTLLHTGFAIHSCVLLMNYRTESSVFFGFHVCDHVFSYSSDYSVVISSSCSVLSVDRRQFPEQEKYVVACITKSGACNLNSLF